MLAMRSKRTAVVVLQSFASGLPLGLVWVAIPDWMRDIGVDIRSLACSRSRRRRGRSRCCGRRSWIATSRRSGDGDGAGWPSRRSRLLVLGLMMAGVGQRPDAIWVVGALAMAIALAAASQDIAIDAYAVEVLRKDEQGAAAGARTAIYRAAYSLAGSVAISMAARLGWPAVNVLLALTYLPMLVITWKSPEPEVQPAPPTTLA